MAGGARATPVPLSVPLGRDGVTCRQVLVRLAADDACGDVGSWEEALSPLVHLQMWVLGLADRKTC